MKNRIKKFYHAKMYFIFFAALIYLPFSASAQWTTNPFTNTPISVESGTQGGSVMVTDGAGGAIIAWTDTRIDGYGDIYAQRIDENGIIKWAVNGIFICSKATLQGSPAIVSDGNGGAIIVWVDLRDLNDPGNTKLNVSIYAQRVNASGVTQWATNGVLICKPPVEQAYPIITSDGSGGVIIAWTDNRNSIGQNKDIYAMGIKADGTIKWPELAVTTGVGDEGQQAITSDGNGGAIITWTDARNADNGSGNASDIYAQRISSSGTPMWTLDGVGICVMERFQSSPHITSDGSNGAIISWLDDRHVNVNADNIDIFAQRVNAAGAVQWTANGVGISTTIEKQGLHTITSDLAGGAVLAWESWTGFESKISVQRVNASGASLWTANGIQIRIGKVKLPSVAVDNGNTFLTWEEERATAQGIYAQKLDGNGTPQWVSAGFGGVVVSNAPRTQWTPRLVLDTQGGAIIVWDDGRNGDSDVYAQHINADGTLGGASVIGSQTITFNTIPEKKFSDKQFTLGAIASSSLPVTYTSSNLSVATVEGDIVTITGVGTSTITANQAGDASFTAAPPVSQQLTVIKGDQVITFNELPTKAPGDPAFTLSANATSDLVISYTSSNNAVATVSGTSVTIVGLGTTNITASQAGNANYNAAASVVQPLGVKAAQSITFSTVADKTVGDPAFAVSATSSSNLPVNFTTASDKISISANQVTILKAGSVTINANQTGNANFAPALVVTKTFCVNPVRPSIIVNGINPQAPVLTSSAATGNQWYKDGVIIPGANNTTYTVTAEGSYTVVASQDNCSSLASIEETVMIITGIEEFTSAIKVYPNPIENELVVDVAALNTTTPVALTLYDVFGRPLYATTGTGLTTIPVGSYAIGVYILRIQNGREVIIKKLKK